MTKCYRKTTGPQTTTWNSQSTCSTWTSTSARSAFPRVGIPRLPTELRVRDSTIPGSSRSINSKMHLTSSTSIMTRAFSKSIVSRIASQRYILTHPLRTFQLKSMTKTVKMPILKSRHRPRSKTNCWQVKRIIWKNRVRQTTIRKRKTMLSCKAVRRRINNCTNNDRICAGQTPKMVLGSRGSTSKSTPFQARSTLNQAWQSR